MSDNLPPGVTLNDVDPPEMEDDPRLMYDTSHVKDTSDWHSGTCECCGGPTRWRWTGLRAVADTGDERMAAKQVVTEAESAAADLAAERERVRVLREALGETESRIYSAIKWLHDSSRWDEPGTLMDGQGSLLDWVVSPVRSTLAATEPTP